MSQRIIAVAGVSGVGKSTFIKNISIELEVQHLQASFLIKEAARERDLKGLEQDALRDLDIDENQALLIHGFNKHKDKSAVVVLDCHTVIDTLNGLVAISPVVFKEIGVSHMIILTDDPAVILSRREKDQGRSRPKRNEFEIESYQYNSILQGYKISQEIEIPLTICKVSCARSVGFIF